MSKIVLALDSHALSMYQTCETKFKYAQVRSIDAIKKKAALSKGTLIHEMLAEYYNRVRLGERPNEIGVDIAQKVLTRSDIDLNFEERQFIGRRLCEYILHYKEDWEPIRVEGFDHTGFSKLLYEDSRVKFIYEGRIDLIVRVGRKFNRWVDFKSQNPKYSFDRFQNVNQFIGYTWASGFQGIIGYITWSKDPTDKTFRRQDISISPGLVEKWKESTINWFHKVLKTLKKGEYEHNFAQCDTKYGPCKFNKICAATNNRAEDWIIANDFEKVERWRAW